MTANPFESSADPATADRVLGALASESRRAVLAHFEESIVETATLDDLTDALLARQTAIEGQSPEQVRLRLHHVHLPKLADVGLLDYDPRMATVRYYGHSLLTEWWNRDV